MRIRIFHKALWIATALWLFISCNEDRGNYDYHWIGDFAVSPLPDTVVRKGDLFIAEPVVYELHWNNPETKDSLTGVTESKREDYTFSWFIREGNQARTLFSQEWNCNMPIHEKASCTYLIELDVTSKKTGVSKSVKFNLEVTSGYRTAFLFLTDNEEGHVELELWATRNDGNKVHDRVLKKSGFPYTTGGAGCVHFVKYRRHSSAAASLQQSKIWISTGSGTGWLERAEMTFTPVQVLPTLLQHESGPFVSILRTGDTDSFYASDYYFFTGDGKVYRQVSNGLFDPVHVAFVNGEAVRVAPMLSGCRSGVLFHDLTHGQLINHQGTVMGCGFSREITDPSVSLAGQEIIYMQGAHTADGPSVIISRSGNRFLKQTYISNGSHIQNTPSVTVLKGNSQEVSHWITGRSNQVVYGIIGNKLHAYNETASAWQPVAVSDPEGNILPSFSFEYPVSFLHTEDYSSEYPGSCIYVVTTDGNNTESKVYILQYRENEPAVFTLKESISGLGRVKSMSFWSSSEQYQ